MVSTLILLEMKMSVAVTLLMNLHHRATSSSNILKGCTGKRGKYLWLFIHMLLLLKVSIGASLVGKTLLHFIDVIISLGC